MSYLPIQNTVPQYVDSSSNAYSGAVLKAYQEGTSTPISFATDSTGNTLVSSVALNASGYPEVSGAIIIPHINQNYKLSLYPTQTAADANSSAIWTVDNINFFSTSLGGSKLSSIGNGTLRDDAIAVGQAQDNQFNALGTTGGSADAYTITASPVITAYVATMEFSVKIHATNATTTPYLQINGISNPASNAVIKKIIDGSEIAVEVGDMVANGIYKIHRNSTNNAWILLNPKYGFQATETEKGIAEVATQAEVDAGTDTERFITPVTLRANKSQYMIVEDQKASGTSGGNSSANTRNTRTLNTVVSNDIAGASLTSNQVTLPAGKYYIRALSMGGACNGHKLFFRNVTDSNDSLLGTSSFVDTNDGDATFSVAEGLITITSSKTFQLEHYTKHSATHGLGYASNSGSAEIYSRLIINNKL